MVMEESIKRGGRTKAKWNTQNNYGHIVLAKRRGRGKRNTGSKKIVKGETRIFGERTRVRKLSISIGQNKEGISGEG